MFSLDLDVVQISELTSLNRNTIISYLAALRARIAEFCEAESPFSGEIEVDESYFDARRVNGIRGRGAYGKTIVFGIFKHIMEKSILKLYRTNVGKHSRISFEERSN